MRRSADLLRYDSQTRYAPNGRRAEANLCPSCALFSLIAPISMLSRARAPPRRAPRTALVDARAPRGRRRTRSRTPPCGPIRRPGACSPEARRAGVRPRPHQADRPRVTHEHVTSRRQLPPHGLAPAATARVMRPRPSTPRRAACSQAHAPSARRLLTLRVPDGPHAVPGDLLRQSRPRWDRARDPHKPLVPTPRVPDRAGSGAACRGPARQPLDSLPLHRLRRWREAGARVVLPPAPPPRPWRLVHAHRRRGGNSGGQRDPGHGADPPATSFVAEACDGVA
jgi:hypothetical protein